MSHDRAIPTSRASVARLIITSVIATVGAILLTGVTGLIAQDSDDFPDLRSDPPENLQPATEFTWQGDDLLIVRFNGFVTNVGAGALHIEGNPQPGAPVNGRVAQILDPGGLDFRQRVYDTSGPNPAIQYENSDDHEHWHLMRIMEYSLWNEARTTQVTAGEKIGFCLWDIELANGSSGSNPVYDGGGNWCAGNTYPGGGPGATYLQMGISAGWRDVYSSSINLQWIDVSDVAPGRYYLGAVADPNDIVDESDETNNDRVWTNEVTVIEGYLAQDVGPVAVNGATSVTLASSTFNDGSATNGAPGARVFRIETAPSNGTLSVPTGVDFSSATITYTPNAGFSGADSFTYSAWDSGSDYPANPDPDSVSATVTVSANSAPVLVDPPDQSNDVGDTITLQLSASDADDDDLTYSATGVPDGITLNPATGRFGGSPTTPGAFTVFATAGDGIDSDTVVFGWSIGGVANQPPTVTNPGAQTSPRNEPVEVQVLANDPEGQDLGFAGSDLPPGLSIGQSTGTISGTPTTAGSYDVTITVTDALLETEVAFPWTITSDQVAGFDDVTTSHIFADAIAWMAGEEITTGCDADSFCPDDPVTRAQVASFFARAFGLTAGTGADLFTDDDGSTHEDNIDRLATAGITNGCTTTTFCPDDRVTRAQFASLLVRATGLTAGGGDDLFTDDDGSAHEDNIDRLATAGITNGCTATTFCPGDTLTRGQLAALLYRADQNSLIN